MALVANEIKHTRELLILKKYSCCDSDTEHYSAPPLVQQSDIVGSLERKEIRKHQQRIKKNKIFYFNFS